MATKKSERADKKVSLAQDRFFALVKQALPNGLGLAEEVAELLNLSLDASYRRLRGQTDITLDEISKLTEKYHVNMDVVLGKRGTTAGFSYIKLTDSEENFMNYLTGLYDQLLVLSKHPGAKLFYVADEAPLFYSFGSRKLAEFKLFFWQRSVLNIERYQHKKFSWGVLTEEILELAENTYKEYMKIPCVEYWTDETVLTNLKQIEFYFESGLLSKTDALDLLHEHRGLMQKILAMAETGRKNTSDQAETYSMYSSELVLGTNCIYALYGDTKYSYISFNSINSLRTEDPDFCEETENWLRNLEKKSTLISGIGEKQRYQFFNRMFKTIEARIEHLTRA
jgi:hypothetical protein